MKKVKAGFLQLFEEKNPVLSLNLLDAADISPGHVMYQSAILPLNSAIFWSAEMSESIEEKQKSPKN